MATKNKERAKTKRFKAVIKETRKSGAPDAKQRGDAAKEKLAKMQQKTLGDVAAAAKPAPATGGKGKSAAA